MPKSFFTFAAATIVVAIHAVGARAESPGACAAYAALAVQQYYTNKSIPGCFKGDNGEWHSDYNRHYGWCLTAGRADIDAQSDDRAGKLQWCMQQVTGR